MTEQERTKERIEKREKAEEAEAKRGIRVLSQIVALLICLLISFAVWLVVHYNADNAAERDAASTSESTFVTVPIPPVA